jgi:phasin
MKVQEFIHVRLTVVSVNITAGIQPTQEKNMSDPFKTPQFDIPVEMRELATKSVEQAKRAFDSFVGATQEASTKFKGSQNVMSEQATKATSQVVGFAEQNVKAAFDHAQALVQAKGFEDVMKLQSEFMKSQIEAMQSQMKSMGEAAKDVVNPKK